MSDEAAARFGDPVGHDWGMAGMIGGALLGAAVGAALVAATVVTGGAAAVAVAGLVAGGALAGGQLARGLQTVMGAQNPTTGTLVQGSPDVFVNGRPAVRAGPDFVASCSGLFGTHHFSKPNARVAEGSATVYIDGCPAARVADRLECAATVTTGSPDVFVGGPTEAVLEVRDNQATWTQVAAVVGLVALGGGAVVAALAGTAALAGFVAVGAAGYGLNEGLGWVGDRMGPGWRDVLQGGAGIAGIVAGAPRGARALRAQQQRQATRERVLANVEASRTARGASGFGGRAPTPRGRAALTPSQRGRTQRRSAVTRQRAAFSSPSVRPLGARGPFSRRDFDPSAAGGPVRALSADRIKFTARGVDVVERHVGRFGPDAANEGMVRRLRDIAAGRLEPTPADRNYYSHELREYVRYRRLGWRDGQPSDADAAYDVWNNCHTATLEDYGLREGPGVLYHPSVDP